MKTRTKQEQMYERIKAHGKNLNAIFQTGLDPVVLCKKLFRIENAVHYLAERYCNGDIDMERWETERDNALDRIDKILDFKEKLIPVFINGDPRGYALQIDDEWVCAKNVQIERVCGGYGLIAPDFR